MTPCEATATAMADVDYAARVLGAQPTERQRAEILNAMTRHGIARDHPALGIIAEMILYREQMERLLTDAAQAAAQCATAGETAAAAAATIAATAGETAAQMQRAEAAAAERLRQPVSEAETALRQEREALLAADRARMADAQRIAATAERRAATALALSWLPAVVLFAAGLLAGGPWGMPGSGRRLRSRWSAAWSRPRARMPAGAGCAAPGEDKASDGPRPPRRRSGHCQRYRGPARRRSGAAVAGVADLGGAAARPRPVAAA